MRRAALPLALLAVLAVLAVVLLATATAASPQPSPICGFCGDRFEDAADDHGVNATVAESTVTIQIHESGSATWTVENHLTNGSARFHEDSSKLSDVGRAMADGSRGVINEARFVSARMDGDTAVLVYRDPGAAERHAGLLVVDYLHHGGYQRWYVVNVDGFAIQGPEGTVVTNDPESGEVTGRAVTWEGSTAGNAYDAPTLDGYPYVVFGPDHSPEATAGTTAAILLASGPLIVESITSFVLFQTIVFAVALAVVVVAIRKRQPEVGVEPFAVAIAGLGGLGGVALVAAFGPGSIPGPAAFGVCVGGLAAHPRTSGYLRTACRQGLVAAGSLVATWFALVAVYAATGAYDDPTSVAVRSTALALPFAPMLPLGGVLEGDDRGVRRWGGATVLAFVAMAPLVVNFAAPTGGLGTFFEMVVLLLAAVVFPVVGALVVALGQALSDERTTEWPDDRSATRELDDV